MSEKIEKAMTLFGEKKYKEAIDAFSSVLETEPDNADVYNNMGVAYSCEGDFEHAEKCYVRAIELDPELAQAYINLSEMASDVPVTQGLNGAFTSFFGPDPVNLMGVVILTSLGTWVRLISFSYSGGYYGVCYKPSC